MTFPLLLLLAAAAPDATAQARYEDRLIERALEQTGRERESEPEAKRISDIQVFSENIVAPSDPWPEIANIIHVQTRERTVRRELLFEVGQAYSPALVAETERNLRRLFIFAVSRIVPVRSRTPGAVSVLVVVKDLWSLRLNWDYTLVGTLLQFLHVTPVEENLFGLDKTAQLDVVLKLDTLAFGEAYYDPRLFGTRLELVEQAALIDNRWTGQVEGSSGQLYLDRPLYSLHTDWGFSVGADWTVQTTRVFQAGTIAAWPNPADDAFLPFIYETKVVEGGAFYSRSFGERFKTNLTAGWGAYRALYTPAPGLAFTPGLTSVAVSAPTAADDAWLQANYLPRSETASYLALGLQAFQADYRVLRDVDSFALSEDFQLGYAVSAVVRWANPAVFSPAQFASGGAAVRYRLYRGDDLLSLHLAGSVRYMPAAAGAGIAPPWVNRRLAAQVLNYSPRVFGGRFVTRALVDMRDDDLNHGLDYLGGDDGLRGIPSDWQSGTRLFLANVEYRTPPFELFTVHVGGVVFYDAGFTANAGAPLIQVLGAGLRILIPQINLQPIRIDFGYAFSGPLSPFSSSFGQVTDNEPTTGSGPLTNYKPSYLEEPLALPLSPGFLAQP